MASSKQVEGVGIVIPREDWPMVVVFCRQKKIRVHITNRPEINAFGNAPVITFVKGMFNALTITQLVIAADDARRNELLH